MSGSVIQTPPTSVDDPQTQFKASTVDPNVKLPPLDTQSFGPNINREYDTTTEALFETISVSPVSTIERILAERPDMVHTKVWHGLTLAHRACMRGDEQVLSVLLQRGSDPDGRTDAGETPLHYACRKGYLPLVSLLLRSGADVLAVDGAGHGCMHFAAQGAAVSVMAYLNEVHLLDYDKQSFALQSALHVAALHGHWPTVMFLLRKQRCDVRMVDVMGNTALHLAARGGQVNICWQMVVQGGASCLSATNSNNMTPFDMATTVGSSPRDKEAQGWLKTIERQSGSKRGSPLVVPKLIWLFNLMYPTLMGLALPQALSVLLPRLRPLLFLGSLFVLARWIVRQDHRVSHPCRWPNTARAGIFLWSGLANLACYFVFLEPLSPVYWLLDWLSWSAIFIFALSLASFLVSRSGRYTLEQPTNFESRKPSHSSRDWSAVEQGTPGANFCDECELIQVLGVRHCRMCGRCYRQLHHHCIFLLRCVTAANATWFQALLAALAASCVLYVANVVAHVDSQRVATRLSGPEVVWSLFTENTAVLVMALIDCLGTAWCVILIRHHRNGPVKVDGHSHV